MVFVCPRIYPEFCFEICFANCLDICHAGKINNNNNINDIVVS